MLERRKVKKKGETRFVVKERGGGWIDL